MRGILATAGAASVAAMSVAAPTPYTLAANVLTVTGYTFGGTIEWEMDEIFQGSLCSAASGNSCTSVTYNDGVSEAAEADGLRALKEAMSTTAPPTVVVGFSQGATIASNWLRENAGAADAPDPEDLSFVLAANPKRKYGGIRSGFGAPTPETEYEVIDVAMEYDGAADFPTDPRNLLALANALAGFAYLHIPGYNDIDLETADKLVWKEGNTTYVLIRRENLPLLEPLRMIGLGELADLLNGPLKEKIDEAYDRDYPGLIGPELHDEVLQSLTADNEADDDTGPAAARFASYTAESDIQDDLRAQVDPEPDSSTTEVDASTDSDDETETPEPTPDEDATAAEDDLDEDAPSAETADDDEASEAGGESTDNAAESKESPSDSGPDTDTGTKTKTDKESKSDSDDSAE